MEMRIYVTANGRKPFLDWLGLWDDAVRYRIRARLDRVELGYFGDYKHISGDLYELRLPFGAGYRIYYGYSAEWIVLLLAGDKGTQKRDIAKAKAYLKDYKESLS